MADSLHVPHPLEVGSWGHEAAVRIKAGDGRWSSSSRSSAPASVDTNGRLALRAVGPGVQTLLDDVGGLTAYLGIQVASLAHSQIARESGGASIVYQRQDSLEVESSDGRFPRICRATTSWFLDPIQVTDGAICCSQNVFRGVGGPVMMSDGTLALAYISAIEWSTRQAIGRWVDDEVRRRQLRRDARREFRSRSLSGCTRGQIALELEVRFYPGPPDREPADFLGGDYQHFRFLLSPVELSHKPFADSLPKVWLGQSAAIAHASVHVAWDLGDPTAPMLAVAGGGFTRGPQRPGREPYEDADIWIFDVEGLQPCE